MFTAPYLVRLPRDKAHGRKISESYAREGWQRHEDPLDGEMVIEAKVFLAATVMNGVLMKRGQRKLTWQVIADSTLYSYDVFANPRYSDAMTALTLEEKVRMGHGVAEFDALALAHPRWRLCAVVLHGDIRSSSK